MRSNSRQSHANQRREKKRFVTPKSFLETPARCLFAGVISGLFPTIEALGIKKIVPGKEREDDVTRLWGNKMGSCLNI